jgi:hypothetical protein
MSVDVQVGNLPEVQDKFEKFTDLLGSEREGVKAILAKLVFRLHRYTSMIVHVRTGRLKNSLFPSVQEVGNNLFGMVGTNVYYAPYEHARGGSHAFFDRTKEEEAPSAISDFIKEIRKLKRKAGL